MKLSIITINYNNAEGLRKTMESVLNQTSKEFEYIVVDGLAPHPSKGGALTDIEVIARFVRNKFASENGFTNCSWNSKNGEIKGGFYSEPDSGIYNAMNKGIRMAKGDYCQFLNSGDILAAADVTERMLSQMPEGDILYGNMLKQISNKTHRFSSGVSHQFTMLDFYIGTLNHSPAYIKRSLFERFGMYDESLKIVSDWKWYLQVIALNGIQPVYSDIDVTLFDMNGISTVNSALDKAERRRVLEELLPASVLWDYDLYAQSILQLKRINRYWFTRKGFWLVERILFKWEKWGRKQQ